MNNEQAKLLLQAYRSRGQDAQDALFTEALEQVRRDPELGRWFEVEQSLDAVISQKLRELPVPATLEANIRAGNIMKRPRPRRWLGLAAAAITLLAAAGIWLRFSDAPQFVEFREEMIQRALHEPRHLAFASSNMTEIRRWIEARGLDAAIDMPAGLATLTPHGCRLLDWNGEKVALVCLVSEKEGHIDLFVTERTRFRGFAPSPSPQYGRSGDLATAAWSESGKTYLLAGKLSEEQIRRLF